MKEMKIILKYPDRKNKFGNASKQKYKVWK